MTTKIKLSLALAAVILTTIIVFQNTEPVETRILFASITMPRALLLGFTFAAGLIVGLLTSFALTGKNKNES